MVICWETGKLWDRSSVLLVFAGLQPRLGNCVETQDHKCYPSRLWKCQTTSAPPQTHLLVSCGFIKAHQSKTDAMCFLSRADLLTLGENIMTSLIIPVYNFCKDKYEISSTDFYFDDSRQAYHYD